MIKDNEDSKKVQAIVYMNGIDAYYLYDEDIEKAIANYFTIISKGNHIAGREIKTVEVIINTPPLTFAEHKEKISKYMKSNGRD